MTKRPIAKPVRLRNAKRGRPKRRDEIDVTRTTHDAFLKAFHRQEILALIEHVAKIPIDDQKILKILEETVTLSDREVGIIIFALVDDLLAFYFRLYLRQDMKGGIEPLFKGHGFLGTADARLTMALSLHWLQIFTFDGLSLMRKIRNHFAHHVDARTFSADPIRSWVHAILGREDVFFRDLDMDGVKLSDRDLFIVKALSHISGLLFDLTMGKHAIERGIHPGEMQPFHSPVNVQRGICIGLYLTQNLLHERYGVPLPELPGID